MCSEHFKPDEIEKKIGWKETVKEASSSINICMG